MDWTQLLELIGKACASQGEDRQVLLVLADCRYHVQEPLTPAGELLGFVIYADDPERAQRTPATRLLFVPASQIQRVLIDGRPEGRSFGFAGA